MKFKIVILLMLTVMISSCSQQEVAKVAEREVPVRAQIVKKSSEKLNRYYTGSLEGNKQARITTRMSEAVDKVNVSEGDFIGAGQILIRLDKHGASSQYQQVKAVYETAAKNFQKMKRLYGEGAISESQYDQSRTDYEVNAAAFDAMRKKVEIETPIAGTVLEINVSEGDFLRAGQVVATVAETDQLRLKIGLSPEDAGRISIGAISNLFDGEEIIGSATVLSIAGQIDLITRLIQVELGVDNRNSKLFPGQFVRLEITLEEVEDELIIPRLAVMRLDNQNAVFVVSNGQAEKRIVSLGMEFDGRVVVLEGLSINDTLVTTGQSYLDDGFKTRIISLGDNN